MKSFGGRRRPRTRGTSGLFTFLRFLEASAASVLPIDTLRTSRTLREASSAAETAAIQRGGAVVLRKRFFVIPAMRQGTAACRGFELAILRNRLFLYRQSSPGTGYIQGRFSAASFCYAQFSTFRFAVGECVITFASRTPLPPSISLRPLCSLRLKILRREKTPANRAEQRFSAGQCSIGRRGRLRSTRTSTLRNVSVRRLLLRGHPPHLRVSA